jgi:hypothetical protein
VGGGYLLQELQELLVTVPRAAGIRDRSAYLDAQAVSPRHSAILVMTL